MAVHGYFQKAGRRPPPQQALVYLFEVMFAASMKREENQAISFHIAYVDPTKPDPGPPKRVARDRWQTIPFAAPIPLTVGSIAKLANASDSRTSSIAAYHVGDAVVMWGLVDQGISYHGLANYDTEAGFVRPGRFQASVEGVGHLVAYDGLTKIAELRAEVLVTSAVDVFARGAIRRAIDPSVRAVLSAVRQATPSDVDVDQQVLLTDVSDDIVASICRLLLRIKSLGHGGAFVITPDRSLKHLNLKYSTNYGRLPTALSRRLLSRAEEAEASDDITGNYMDEGYETVPTHLHIAEVIAGWDIAESDREIDGVIWFIALLTRVDGLVVLTPDLHVQGFGAEITCQSQPATIHRSSSPNVNVKSLRPMNYQHFGTRHRSMMRYVNEVPGSLGFVISQDGDVRALQRVGQRVIMWENLKLQRHTFPPAEGRAASRANLRGVP